MEEVPTQGGTDFQVGRGCCGGCDCTRGCGFQHFLHAVCANTSLVCLSPNPNRTPEALMHAIWVCCRWNGLQTRYCQLLLPSLCSWMKRVGCGFPRGILPGHCETSRLTGTVQFGHLLRGEEERRAQKLQSIHRGP